MNEKINTMYTVKGNTKLKASSTGLSYNSVLIIDDDKLDLFITEGLLRNGANIGKVRTAQDPLKALDTLKSAKSARDMPDLIILDLKMPGFDGFAFLKELSGLPTKMTQQCEVMVLSAYLKLEPELIDRTKKYPFVSKYLRKPLDVNQMQPV